MNHLSMRVLPVLALGLATAMGVGAPDPATPPRRMENLSRGIVAVRQPGGVYIGWRLFGTDPQAIAFNLYRVTGDGAPQRVNDAPITGSTNYVDGKADPNQALRYFVRPVLDGRELAPSKPATAWDRPYIEIPIRPITEYWPGDCSVGDLDGDGDYEIVLHQTSRGRDNGSAGMTGRPVLDAYRLDGAPLWRIDLGINIREGEHYTQFMVYDLDGDGRAEMVCKTADGTTDGVGTVIGDKDKDWRTNKPGDRTHGRILDGPEYLTVFDGRTGAAMKTVDYIANRDPIDGWGGIGGNGGNDSYGNRCDRFLACVAYLDGVRPSVVMCRGVYGRTVLAAWDWREGELTSRWVFDSGISRPPYSDASPYSGMGGHSLSVADVDADGKDEIVYHAMVVDDDGKGLYSTGWRHGDGMHLSDMYPDRPGLEVFTIHENEDDTVRFQSPGAAMRDARTGEAIWKHSPGIDVSNGVAADIDPRHRGFEAWGGPGGLRNAGGAEIGRAPRSTGFVIWWDGDLLRELLAGSTVLKWNWQTATEERLFSTGDRWGWRGPNLQADLLGDWREEMLVTAPDGKSLRMYTTTIPTEYRIYTLMHDPQYRLAVAWQNVVYNKPPHPGFYLGDGMAAPPVPSIRLIGKGEALAGVEAQ
ncbi:MAG TPA: rhamnogalacturonan lyase [Sedimentisphaerales bacterium]|jgi:rhamnogalacturonan endolyase|nr:rhamnogalacturonan lyase [Sedimentisphaerales bacterium]HNU28330.1 rhamnogalacturonan lyase [Sedimentisphaerales bacterium]